MIYTGKLQGDEFIFLKRKAAKPTAANKNIWLVIKI